MDTHNKGSAWLCSETIQLEWTVNNTGQSLQRFLLFAHLPNDVQYMQMNYVVNNNFQKGERFKMQWYKMRFY